MPKFQLIHKVDYDGEWYHIVKNDTTIKSIKVHPSLEDEALIQALDEYERILNFQVQITILKETEL